MGHFTNVFASHKAIKQMDKVFRPLNILTRIQMLRRNVNPTQSSFQFWKKSIFSKMQMQQNVRKILEHEQIKLCCYSNHYSEV